MNASGIKADIVTGEINIGGINAFDATLDLVKDEVASSELLDGPQSIHAWISLGDDTIIDAALPARLAMHFSAPSHFEDMIFIGRAGEFAAKYEVRYVPIIVGTEFFAKTNPPDPMDLLDAWT